MFGRQITVGSFRRLRESHGEHDSVYDREFVVETFGALLSLGNFGKLIQVGRNVAYKEVGSSVRVISNSTNDLQQVSAASEDWDTM